MSPSRPFILRPVATSLLMVAILLAGAVAYQQLPVSALPQVDYPTIQVLTFYPGASPEVMSSSVTSPLERQFGQIPGLAQMTSTRSGGGSVITLQFSLSESIDIAQQDVQAAINAGYTFLPKDLPNPPVYSKVNPADSPIMTLALTSDSLQLSKVEDLADTILAQKISQLSGVGLVSIAGGQKPAVRIQANPTALAGYGLSLEDLRTALASANVDQAKGSISGPRQAYTIGANDQLLSSADYSKVVIAYRNGSPVRLSDVANSVDSAENLYQAAWMGTAAVPATRDAPARDAVLKPAVILNIQRQPGANIIGVVDEVQAILPQLRQTLPASVNLEVLTDRTNTIRASVKDVQFELILTICLVVMVIFLFLRSIAATVIPAVAVPLSIVGTFGVMYLLGYSLNNLSLMALTISTGFVVDDAIVMVENISRYLEEGDDPLTAALKGSEQIGFTILSLTVSLIAVLIPLLFMGDIVGRLFREFAVTLSAAIVVSLIVSLTTTPMLSAKFLQAHSKRKHGRLYKFGERALDLLTNEYDRGLKWVLRHQPIMLLVTVATFVLTIYLFTIVPKGFFPQQDTGRIGGQIRAQQDTSFDNMKDKMIRLSNIARQDPAVMNVMSFAGGGGGGSNTANLFMFLRPDAERQKSGDTAEIVLNRLRPRVNAIPGAQLFLQSQQELNIGGRPSATQYQYSLTADTVAELNTWAPLLMARMLQMPELKDVATDQMQNGLRAQLIIDRDTASRLGVSPLAIDATLSDAFGQRQVSTTYMPLNQYHVVMEAAQEFQQDPTVLQKIFVKSTTGAMVPLSAVTHYVEQRIPLQVNHQGLSPAATLSFNLTPGYSLSQATASIEAARISIAMPSTIHGGFQGTAQAFQASLSSEPILIALALVAVYIVLGILYESFIHPLTILSTLPSAGVGALVALLLMKVDLSVIAMIGIILLIGIVKKNAIMMIDFALVAEREGGKTPEEAIYEACLLRFRPIMMTTMAALLGGLPLALGTGTGSELRRPLGITIVGGLIVSQCLTLFTTPVVYLFFDRLRLRAERLFNTRKRTPPPHALPVTGD